VTRLLPNSASTPGRTGVEVARSWAYLLCANTYVPLVQADLEAPLREMVADLFDALDQAEMAERVGARLVELNCVDRKSLQITVDVLAAPLLAEGTPEQVARLLGALAAGFADRLRSRTTEQQESMVRAVKALAMKATRVAQANQTQRDAMATELSLLRRQLSHQLLHDALTGLPNKQFFTTRLEEVLNSGCPTTLYRIELNGFTTLNDGLGAPLADALLVDVTTRLRAAMHGEDAMVAHVDRAGFAVLVEHRPEASRPASPPACVADRFAEALAETMYVGEVGLALTANVGVVQSPPHGTNHTEFLQAADLALRFAKEQGPGRWRLLTPEEAPVERESLRLAAVMPGVVEMGGLTIGYRLRVGLSDERPVAVDAFPRWEDAGLDGVECVALAEQTGLSTQIPSWLLREAGEQVLSWDTELPVSVDLSPEQAAAPDLVDSVLGTWSDLSLPPDRLRLALPAAEVFDGRPQSLDNLTALAEAGVRTAVHDFHGNPSEVVRLPDLPLRAVSLAPRLVAQARAVGEKPLVTQVMSGLTTLVHEAGATVSVDDLRSEPEVTWWRRAGADVGAGPLFPTQGRF
jgi:diguanylate cyclase (GGDEF)-like protein